MAYWNGAVALSTSGPNCCVMVREPNRLTMSPTTMPRTPPRAFCNCDPSQLEKVHGGLWDLSCCQRFWCPEQQMENAWCIQQRPQMFCRHAWRMHRVGMITIFWRTVSHPEIFRYLVSGDCSQSLSIMLAPSSFSVLHKSSIRCDYTLRRLQWTAISCKQSNCNKVNEFKKIVPWRIVSKYLFYKSSCTISTWSISMMTFMGIRSPSRTLPTPSWRRRTLCSSLVSLSFFFFFFQLLQIRQCLFWIQICAELA